MVSTAAVLMDDIYQGVVNRIKNPDLIRFGGVGPEVLSAISEKLEKEIDAKLKEVLIGPDLNKALIIKAKTAVNEILAKHYLEDKIDIAIHIAPDGVAEVYFSTKTKMGSLH